MSIVLDGTTGVTAPAFDGALDATDLTGNIAAARITTALNATGSAPIFACRAWVNFNGTGTVAIRASGNVSSITDNAVGEYTVNLAEIMPDINYAAIASCNELAGVTNTMTAVTKSFFTSSFRVAVTRADSGTNTLSDVSFISASIFR